MLLTKGFCYWAPQPSQGCRALTCAGAMRSDRAKPGAHPHISNKPGCTNKCQHGLMNHLCTPPSAAKLLCAFSVQCVRAGSCCDALPSRKSTQTWEEGAAAAVAAAAALVHTAAALPLAGAAAAFPLFAPTWAWPLLLLPLPPPPQNRKPLPKKRLLEGFGAGLACTAHGQV